MSSIEDAFRQSRIQFGLKQKPNWQGAVWGVCTNKGCGNYKKIGEYLGGFCKVCSVRHREDHNLAVISTIKTRLMKQNIPNPRIRWIKKMWVKDMSHTMTPQQRKKFYEIPDPDKPPKEDLEDISEIPQTMKVEQVLKRLGGQ